MKLKPVFAAVMCAALLCGAGGCNVTDISKEDLLRPPKTMGDEAEIEALISKSAKGGYTLKYPKSGSNRSAIVMHDLNGDNTDEAIAFFRDKDGATGVRMLVMYEEEGTWKISGDFVTETSDVDCVDFADINENDSQEIVVGYATYTANVNFLSVYSFEKGKTYAVESGQNYSAFYCGSLDSGGKSKIITLSLFSTENEARATLLDFNANRNAMYAKATAAMDSNVVSYQNVVFSELSNSVRGLIVDGITANGEMNTQVIYYSKDQKVLKNPLFKEKTANPTQRGSIVTSADNDNDMKFEIPTVSALPYNKSSGAFTAADQVMWNLFDVQSEALNPVQRTVANYIFGYSIKIPEAWMAGTFTALLNESSDTMSFCAWDKNAAGAKLFDIRVFKVADWDKGAGSEKYTLIYKDNRYAYAFINYAPDSELATTDDAIKTAFSLLGINTNTTGKTN